MPKSSPWFEILLVARKLSPDLRHLFTAAQLAEAARIAPGPRSAPAQIASAWMSKFVKWGYATRVGGIEGAGVRMANTYAVTDKGHAAEPREGRAAQIERLVAAVRAYQAARGTRGEAGSFKNLVDTCDAIEGKD